MRRHQAGLVLDTVFRDKFLLRFLPIFIYFDEYSIMKGKISLQDMIARSASGDIDEPDRTFLALLELAGVRLKELAQGTRYETIKAEMEAASINISDEVFEFWSQNKQ